MAEKQKDFSLLPKVLNGAIAGVVGIICVYPLDLVKTRLQNQPVSKTGDVLYTGMLDAFKKIYRSEGFFGMYKGVAVNAFLIAPETAIKLAANDFFRYHLKKADNTLPIYRQGLAGALTAACHITVTTPMELLKIQMQEAGRLAARQQTAIKKISATGVALQLFREKGIFGLYKGLSAAALRDVPFAILYFPLFAILNEKGPRKWDGSGEAVFWWSLFSGLLAGAFSAAVVTPCDVVKTRLQAIDKAKGEVAYTGIGHAFTHIYKHEGPIAFTKGTLCRMIVIAPLFGICQMVYYLGVAEKILGVERSKREV